MICLGPQLLTTDKERLVTEKGDNLWIIGTQQIQTVTMVLDLIKHRPSAGKDIEL